MYDDQRAKRRDKKKLTSQKEKSDLYLPIKSPCLDETNQREISVTMREKLFLERKREKNISEVEEPPLNI